MTNDAKKRLHSGLVINLLRNPRNAYKWEHDVRGEELLGC